MASRNLKKKSVRGDKQPPLGGSASNGNGKRTGRPSSYNKDIHPPLAYRLLKEIGLIESTVAKLMGISEPTFIQWKKDHDEFAKSIRKGKDEFDTSNVESALLRRAMGYKVTETKTEGVTLKRGKGEDAIELPANKLTTTVKEIAPDTGAAIFWLCNRNPKRWKQMKHELFSGSMQHNVKHNHEIDVDKMPRDKVELLRDIIKDFEKGTTEQTTSDA